MTLDTLLCVVREAPKCLRALGADVTRLATLVPHRVLRARSLSLLRLLATPGGGCEARVVREFALVLQAAGGIGDTSAASLALREDVLLTLGAIFDAGTSLGQETFRVHG